MRLSTHFTLTLVLSALLLGGWVAADSKNVQQITDANFEATVLKATLPVVVHAWAAWDGPAVRLQKDIDKLADEMKGKVIFGKLDIDDNPSTPAQFGVRAAPTLLLFQGGELKAQLVGLKPIDEVRAFVTQNVAKP